ncbi:SH3 domain-containing protein [Coleofasciculus sp. FACHB-SPT9]|uniref:SH3 domain-containing protein n=1 Tax=Cyanophyceae TaxID=3028117 RepID=UPI0030D7C638
MKFKRLIPWLAISATAFSIPTPAVLAQYTFGNERSQCRATLTANEPNSRITLRSGAGSNYKSLGYGLAGDRVQVLTVSPPEVDYEQDGQGNGWYRIGFPRSGAKGWIREDFLRVQCTLIND